MSGPLKRLPKLLDRAGFEADKKLRANRAKSDAGRIGEQIEQKTKELGQRVIELSESGAALDESLKPLVAEINTLKGKMQSKEDELRAINAEQWTEPVPPPPPPAPPDAVAMRIQSYVELKPEGFNCPSCGTLIRNNKSFCPKCGRKVIR